ncbi:hypothetical protein [Cupriavidus necator]|nr:hypothetical protein [Cupriavidus necator]
MPGQRFFKASRTAFRYEYRINGRREMPTIGGYGFGGMSLAVARKK